MFSALQVTPSASSTSNIQLITDALVSYANITGIQYTGSRPSRKSLPCRRDRRCKFSRGNPRTVPRTIEGIQAVQGLSGRKSDTNQLPQRPYSECHQAFSGCTGHSSRHVTHVISRDVTLSGCHVPRANACSRPSSRRLPLSVMVFCDI